MSKTYYFANSEHAESIYGKEELPICIDFDEVSRLAKEWDMTLEDLLEQMHEATEDEKKEYGVFDSDIKVKLYSSNATCYYNGDSLDIDLDIGDCLLDLAQTYIDDGTSLRVAMDTEESEYEKHYAYLLREAFPHTPDDVIERTVRSLMINVSSRINDAFRSYYEDHAPHSLVDC